MTPSRFEGEILLDENDKELYGGGPWDKSYDELYIYRELAKSYEELDDAAYNGGRV